MSIRAAYPTWPRYNRSFRDAVAALTDDQLAFQPSADRWPLWATIGHTACQRVSGLCGLAGEPGADATPFPNALYYCPGDEDLENVLNAQQLADALDSTFRIIENCLDRWTFGMLAEELRRQFETEEWVSTRGAVLQRTFTHDVSHITEVNEILTAIGVPPIDLWN